MNTARLIPLILILMLLGAVGWKLLESAGEGGGKKRGEREQRPAPVISAPIERSGIALERHFSGTLEASAEFVAAPKVSGIVQELAVHLGDSIQRGQILARLDDAEYVQAVAQAEAELAVAQANQAEAKSLLTIAERELERNDQLQERGVGSASQRDLAVAEQLARQAGVAVTRAELRKAESALKMTQIRLGYTEVRANWQGDDGQRQVAERFVDEGENVSANAPLLRIVRLDPIIAVLHVTERDYAGLKVGQEVALSTDAYPGDTFRGSIRRIAPVFREASRQARIEVEATNPALQLKPGMFVRASVVLQRLDEATLVPAAALTRRDGIDGLFVLSADRSQVRWQPVQPGIRQGDRLQVKGDDLSGEVVVLGQQLLQDGSAILLPEEPK